MLAPLAQAGYAFERLVVPAVRDFKPDLIIVGSGLDANIIDPLSRLLLHSDSYRELATMMMTLAGEVCGGRLAMIQEAYVPFCGLAIMETLAAHRTKVADPALEIFQGWQPSERFDAYARGVIDDYASSLAHSAV
ncbi:hypothetical protein [Lichenicoccus sp.]|uniref:hypothetical protein n=1 Tax=Lichenicoccus sp. TaxID=2781899 RepID=UPI003D0E189D